jgi:phosphatidylserine/phosphatidylglycerophosphate/cardiolipin synthase-like enzyme
MSPFHQLSRPALKTLSEALAHQRIQLPSTPIALQRLLPDSLTHSIASELNHLHQQGMTAHHIAYTLDVLAQERLQVLHQDPINLVWTGPKLPGSESRDTAIVVQELFTTAQHSILISSFALDWSHKGRALFHPLAQRMETHPTLQVRIFLNIQRQYRDPTASSTLLRQFCENFRHFWPGSTLPKVFYDPRSLDPAGSTNACLHAKCVVADDTRTFITSANFTQAAHYRNIEAGILLDNPVLARAICSQFEMLVAHHILSPILL